MTEGKEIPKRHTLFNVRGGHTVVLSRVIVGTYRDSKYTAGDRPPRPRLTLRHPLAISFAVNAVGQEIPRVCEGDGLVRRAAAAATRRSRTKTTGATPGQSSGKIREVRPSLSNGVTYCQESLSGRLITTANWSSILQRQANAAKPCRIPRHGSGLGWAWRRHFEGWIDARPAR